MFAAASGTSLADCHWVGLRFAGPAFKPTTGDSWIGASDASGHRSHGNTPGWVTGMWRSERQLWASLAGGRVSMRPSLGADEVTWQRFPLDATLMGIWGLRDDLVFAWGMRRTKRVAFCFDGEAWREIEVPGFVVAIGGVRDDLIYAVGNLGLVARWDGDAFRRIEVPAASTIAGICVVSDDELYACGHGGELLRGTTRGWQRIAESELMLGCVAKLGDEVWVGAGEDGLLRLDGDTLELVEPDILAERFDARGRLLITTPDALVETADGRTFASTPSSAFAALTADKAPRW